MHRLWSVVRAVAQEMRGDTLHIRAHWGEVDLPSLEGELNNDIATIARDIARTAVRTSAEKRIEAARPPGYADMVVRAILGVASPEERTAIEEYQATLGRMRAEEAALLTFIDSASPDELNAYPWPEWVEWTPVPSRVKLEPL